VWSRPAIAGSIPHGRARAHSLPVNYVPVPPGRNRKSGSRRRFSQKTVARKSASQWVGGKVPAIITLITDRQKRRNSLWRCPLCCFHRLHAWTIVGGIPTSSRLRLFGRGGQQIIRRICGPFPDEQPGAGAVTAAGAEDAGRIEERRFLVIVNRDLLRPMALDVECDGSMAVERVEKEGGELCPLPNGRLRAEFEPADVCVLTWENVVGSP
jgi:hypothetical protein